MIGSLTTRFPELDGLDAGQRATVMANARRKAAAAHPLRMVAQIVVPPIAAIAAVAVILLVIPEMAATLLGRTALCIPAILIALALYHYLRAVWIRPFLDEELDVIRASGLPDKG